MNIRRADIERYCAIRQITVQALGDELLSWAFRPVPGQDQRMVLQSLHTVNDILEERQRQRLANEYTTQDVCPHCGAEPAVTGGRHPTNYCPICRAVLLDVIWDGGICYRLWSDPIRRNDRSAARTHHKPIVAQCQEVTR